MRAHEKTIPPQAHPCLTEALDRLIELYTNWHAAEPNKGYDAKAAEWQKKRDEHNPALPTEKPARTSEK